MINNNAVTTDDIKITEKIVGPDVEILKARQLVASHCQLWTTTSRTRSDSLHEWNEIEWTIHSYNNLLKHYVQDSAMVQESDS